MVYTNRLEASVVHSVLTQLDNLGWIVDEKDPQCNVTQQRPKTKAEQKKLKGKSPDFVLYQHNTNTPIGIIETKRPNESIAKALKQAENSYARPLDVPLIFAYNDTYVEAKHIFTGRSLKVDGEDIRQFIDHYTALRFIEEGPEILSAPEYVQHSRDQLIKIFKKSADLLREAGIQAGSERFSAFSDVLFLKILDEICELRRHAGEPAPIPEHIRWKRFQDISDKTELLTYMQDVVWRKMQNMYGAVFSDTFPIHSPDILKDIIEELSKLNLTSTKTDVKGDAFEYFFKNAYQGLRIKDLGEYFTPRNIVRTMVSMANPKYGEKIYDPFCGTGGFLIEAFRYLKVRTKMTGEVERTLKRKTIYGTEITSIARNAKMNMILFGDGHANVRRGDSFAKPIKGKYDIVLTNPPYSQKTRHGNLYPIPSQSGDAISIQHIYESLNETGRAAFLVKEDFLGEGGDIGRVREYILKDAKNFSVVSLPRKLFEPYTPTKTNIVYFEKAGKRSTTFFYVVRSVGHELTARKRSLQENDLPLVLDAFNEQARSHEIDSCIVSNEIIEKHSYSLWPFDYMELIPDSSAPLEYLGKYIEEVSEKVDLSEYPDEEFTILGVTNVEGVYKNETLRGEQINQKYKKVHVDDLAYNPHRVNVGSIGIVSKEHLGGYMPNIYVMFRSKEPEQIPAVYVLSLLKSKPYRKIIETYDTKHGAVRANLTYEQLCRIKIPILDQKQMKKFMGNQKEVKEAEKKFLKKQSEATKSLTNITSGRVKCAGTIVNKGGRPDIPVKIDADFDTAMDAFLAKPQKKKKRA